MQTSADDSNKQIRLRFLLYNLACILYVHNKASRFGRDVLYVEIEQRDLYAEYFSSKLSRCTQSSEYTRVRAPEPIS